MHEKNWMSIKKKRNCCFLTKREKEGRRRKEKPCKLVLTILFFFFLVLLGKKKPSLVTNMKVSVPYFQVYFGMLDALLASEQLPEEYRDRCQVKILHIFKLLGSFKLL